MGFDDLYGNRRIKHILSSYLRNDIIPYSMIFTGPRSANIAEFALAFAKAINCLENKDDFCDLCRACTEINQDGYPDLRTLHPDGQFFKKEQITYLVEDNFKKPLKGKKKIYILHDAHHMNESSANAFLKVLEEPALSNMFLLLTDNLSGLLPTIKSRCQILKFSPLSKAEIKEYFIAQGDDPETARLKSYLSQSNMDSVMTTDFSRFMEKRAQMLTALTALLQNRGIETVLLDLFKRSRSRDKFLVYFREMVNILALMLRDITVLAIDPDSHHIINLDYKEPLLKLKQYIKIEQALFLIRRMEYIHRDIKRNLNSKVLIQEFIKSYTDKEAYDV